MKKVFVSYTTRDRKIKLDFLKKLKVSLDSLGLESFIDELDNITPNKSRFPGIKFTLANIESGHQELVLDRLNSCSYILSITSAISSPWVHFEIEYAKDNKIPIIDLDINKLLINGQININYLSEKIK